MPRLGGECFGGMIYHVWNRVARDERILGHAGYSAQKKRPGISQYL